MAYRRCESGEHHYDDAQHTGCPFCRRTRVNPLPRGPAGFADIPPPQDPPRLPERTTPAPDGGKSRSGENGKTILIFEGMENKDLGDVIPVVGWLVVVKGKGCGKYLPIFPGSNEIGRDVGQIKLNFGDQSISSEKNAFLAYESGEFTLVKLQGRNPIKVNGETVHNTRKLAPYDRILIGQTELIFVPLCGPNFSWKVPEDS